MGGNRWWINTISCSCVKSRKQSPREWAERRGLVIVVSTKFCANIQTESS